MKKFLPLLATPSLLFAHHGVASLGVAGLEGPGAPLETSTSATIPEGSFLFYLKLDHSPFKKYTPQRDDETDLYQFWIFGLGYGVKSWLSLYLFVPYNYKKKEDNSYNVAGFGDPFVTAVLGFKYDEGFKLVPPDESLDELMDWHFTLFGSVSLPTAEDRIRNSAGEIDPAMSLGYGKPTVTVGLSATKMLTEKLTLTADASYMKFFENDYGDFKYKFGDEVRMNVAVAYRLLTVPSRKLRLDGILEMNFLNLNRDEENGVKLEASGGKILYTTFGGRLYYKTVSASLGLKLPTWKDLNEEGLQQGSEGKERYRLIFTFSVLF